MVLAPLPLLQIQEQRQVMCRYLHRVALGQNLLMLSLFALTLLGLEVEVERDSEQFQEPLVLVEVVEAVAASLM
jgi:hypothetical protein